MKGTIRKMFPHLKVGMKVSTNGDGLTEMGDMYIEGVIGEIDKNNIYIWQNDRDGLHGMQYPSSRGFDFSWHILGGSDAEIQILDSVKMYHPLIKTTRNNL